jgi:hypothetical protein
MNLHSHLHVPKLRMNWVIPPCSLCFYDLQRGNTLGLTRRERKCKLTTLSPTKRTIFPRYFILQHHLEHCYAFRFLMGSSSGYRINTSQNTYILSGWFFYIFLLCTWTAISVLWTVKLMWFRDDDPIRDRNMYQCSTWYCNTKYLGTIYCILLVCVLWVDHRQRTVWTM